MISENVIIIAYLCNDMNKTVKEKDFWSWVLTSCPFLVYNIFYVPIGVLEIFITQYYESCKIPEIKKQE